MRTATQTNSITPAPRYDAIVTAFETLKGFDGKRETFRMLEAIRCLDYIFAAVLRPHLDEAKASLFADNQTARRDLMAVAVQDIESRLRDWGYIV